MSENIYSKTSYHYHAPEQLIAQTPTTNRGDSRLLQLSADGQISHHKFQDLVEILPSNTLIIMNDTKVFQARLIGNTETGGKCELLLLENTSDSVWLCFGKPVKKLKNSKKLIFRGGLTAEIIEINPSSEELPSIKVKFSMGHNDLHLWLEKHGSVPLPPYIKRKDHNTDKSSLDRQRYQTVYASQRGSVAAPTAGLHFTENIIAELKSKGIDVAYTTLHVGAGTFLPVKSDDIRQHSMHTEYYTVPNETLEKIQSYKKSGAKIICVGTTSLRCLEAFYLESVCNKIDMSELTDKWLKTDLFIHPTSTNETYRPWAVDALLTNFHQPESSLLMLVSALIGPEKIKKIYKEAIEERYRLFSYGDASLLWLQQ